jgi:hypothetical protein
VQFVNETLLLQLTGEKYKILVSKGKDFCY